MLQVLLRVWSAEADKAPLTFSSSSVNPLSWSADGSLLLSKHTAITLPSAFSTGAHIRPQPPVAVVVVAAAAAAAAVGLLVV